MTEQSLRAARVGVGWSELRGQEVVHVFGMPSRVDSSSWGPSTRALWESTVATARQHGSTTLDLDAWDAAMREDHEH